MQIHNTHGSGLTLPHGQYIAPGNSAEVDAGAWAEAKKHPVVGHWIDSGMLKAGAGKAKDDDEATKRKAAAAELLEKANDMHFQTFAAEARKLLGDSTPDKKEEIVEALKKASA